MLEPTHTYHAVQRMAERHLGYDEVQYVIRHGKRYYRTGVLFVYLRGKDIPETDRRFNQYSRLEGTAVLLDSRDGTNVITTYRNRGKNALKDIRRKPNYDRRSGSRSRVA